MSVDALTLDHDGSPIVPGTDDDWRAWVSAGRTRNAMLRDHLVDWLDAHGEARGYSRDDLLPGYDDRTDFVRFLFRKGAEFETKVVELLRRATDVITLCEGPDDIRDLAAARRTFELMCDGVPVIHQGALRHAETRTYGAPDLLVRSDVLRQLFPDAIDEVGARVGAPDLGGQWHYRIVDVKYTTIGVGASGMLGNSGSAPAYKAQLYVYARALAALQGYEPARAYLLGRSWRRQVKGETVRGSSCMERLGGVAVGHDAAGFDGHVDAAVEWVRRVRLEGEHWDVVPEPSHPELYPNMAADGGSWRATKAQLADELEELTLVWQVGYPKRVEAHARGVRGWRDPSCTAAVLGVNGPMHSSTLDAMLDLNRRNDGPPVGPVRVLAARDTWWKPAGVEFYVDFETVSDLDDDFVAMPNKGGQPLIFMIGCGHVEDGEWRFECFTADALREDEEARVIDAWLAHMDATRQRLDPGGGAPLVFHWSHAETSTFETAYNSAKTRHPDKSWPTPNWFDFLGEVMRAEPVLVRGALGFGLKAVARAFHRHGLIETAWDAGPADGMGAMVGAWWCAAEAQRDGRRLGEIELMRDIARYNEVDCRVMMEIVRYLRQHH